MNFIRSSKTGGQQVTAPTNNDGKLNVDKAIAIAGSQFDFIESTPGGGTFTSAVKINKHGTKPTMTVATPPKPDHLTGWSSMLNEDLVAEWRAGGVSQRLDVGIFDAIMHTDRINQRLTKSLREYGRGTDLIHIGDFSPRLVPLFITDRNCFLENTIEAHAHVSMSRLEHVLNSGDGTGPILREEGSLFFPPAASSGTLSEFQLPLQNLIGVIVELTKNNLEVGEAAATITAGTQTASVRLNTGKEAERAHVFVLSAIRGQVITPSTSVLNDAEAAPYGTDLSVTAAAGDNDDFVIGPLAEATGAVVAGSMIVNVSNVSVRVKPVFMTEYNFSAIAAALLKDTDPSLSSASGVYLTEGR